MKIPKKLISTCLLILFSFAGLQAAQQPNSSYKIPPVTGFVWACGLASFLGYTASKKYHKDRSPEGQAKDKKRLKNFICRGIGAAGLGFIGYKTYTSWHPNQPASLAQQPHSFQPLRQSHSGSSNLQNGGLHILSPQYYIANTGSGSVTVDSSLSLMVTAGAFCVGSLGICGLASSILRL